MKSNFKEHHEIVRQWIRITEKHKLVYRVLRSQKYSEDLEWFTTFGVEVIDKTGNRRSCLEDISPDCDAVLRFAGLCLELEVDPDHLRDTAENFLAVHYGGVIGQGVI